MTDPPFCTVRVILSECDGVGYALLTQPRNSEEARDIYKSKVCTLSCIETTIHVQDMTTSLWFHGHFPLLIDSYLLWKTCSLKHSLCHNCMWGPFMELLSILLIVYREITLNYGFCVAAQSPACRFPNYTTFIIILYGRCKVLTGEL